MSSKGDGRTSNFSLRSWVYIDRMQPQYAAYAGSVIQGDVPIAGMAELFVEVAPSNEIYRVADVALKGADVKPATQFIEREFGLLEVHSFEQSAVQAAGRAVLEYTELTVADVDAPAGRVVPGDHERRSLPGAADQPHEPRRAARARPHAARARDLPGGVRDAGRERGREGREPRADPPLERRAVRPGAAVGLGERDPGGRDAAIDAIENFQPQKV